MPTVSVLLWWFTCVSVISLNYYRTYCAVLMVHSDGYSRKTVHLKVLQSQSETGKNTAFRW